MSALAMSASMVLVIVWLLVMTATAMVWLLVPMTALMAALMAAAVLGERASQQCGDNNKDSLQEHNTPFHNTIISCRTERIESISNINADCAVAEFGATSNGHRTEAPQLYLPRISFCIYSTIAEQLMSWPQRPASLYRRTDGDDGGHFLRRTHAQDYFNNMPWQF